ncbi:hypothetical protein ACOSQ2_007239 [Xanthoceras sorbifolium]
MAGNQFSGQLPENLCARGVSQGVVAFTNNRSGKGPKSLGNCSTLHAVQLYNNRFSGEIAETTRNFAYQVRFREPQSLQVLQLPEFDRNLCRARPRTCRIFGIGKLLYFFIGGQGWERTYSFAFV